MIGYKGFNAGLINRYGRKFEEGKAYSLDGEISFGNNGNGFHFCLNLCDVFRYFDPNEGVEVAVVSTEDKDKDIVYYEDEYNGYYDMYVCRNLKIEKVLTREEVVDLILKSPSEGKIKFIRTSLLSLEECNKFIGSDNEVNKALKYYQFGDKEIYKRENGYSKSLKY